MTFLRQSVLSGVFVYSRTVRITPWRIIVVSVVLILPIASSVSVAFLAALVTLLSCLRILMLLPVDSRAPVLCSDAIAQMLDRALPTTAPANAPKEVVATSMRRSTPEERALVADRQTQCSIVDA